MKILVTGSSGHLGEAVVRTLSDSAHDVVGFDILGSEWTSHIGSITDRRAVRTAMTDVDAVIHSATLHKPHVATHAKRDFVDVNVGGTVVVLEEAVRAGVSRLVFTSTTSTFAGAMMPAPGRPAAWITEDVRPIPRNVYGSTKTAAEDLCQVVAAEHGLPVVVLRTSRFFAEPDDRPDIRSRYDDLNSKVNELLYRRIDIADVVDAHLRALERAPDLGFGRYVISATTPFSHEDLAKLAIDAPAVVQELFPDFDSLYRSRGWQMFPTIDRVYVNDRARTDLGWKPEFGFGEALDAIRCDMPVGSGLARAVGSKGYY